MVVDEGGVIAVAFSKGGDREQNSFFEKCGEGVLPGAKIPHPLHTQCCSYVGLMRSLLDGCLEGYSALMKYKELRARIRIPYRRAHVHRLGFYWLLTPTSALMDTDSSSYYVDKEPSRGLGGTCSYEGGWL